MNSFLKTLQAVAAAFLVLAFGGLAQASTWPEKTVRLIVAYPPGGVSDSVTRALAEQLAAQLKVSFVVENKGGAGGTIAMAEIARAQPDGYTLVFSSISPLSLSPVLRKLSYDADTDVQPVASVMASPVILLGTPAFQGSAFSDIITASREAPGSVRWSTSGQGSVGHLMLEQLQQLAKIELTHIPYKGAGQQLTDGIGGQYELISTNMSPALMAQVESGAFRPLAVAADGPVAFLPNVPTFADLGYASAGKQSVFGFFAPAGIDAETLARMNEAINKAAEQPAVKELLSSSHNLPLAGTSAQFSELIQADAKANRKLIESAGLTFD